MSDHILDFPHDVGLSLAKLRNAAGLKQADISGNLSVDPSRVSRIESGGFSPTQDEVEQYLKAVDTDDAQAYLAFLKQRWRVLERPSFWHRERDALFKAETFLQKLDDLLSKLDVPGLLTGQIDMYRKSLLRLANYLAHLNHSIAYIGDLGVGKTTVVCVQTGLVLPESENSGLSKIVLETGAGGTTVCEVRIQFGLEFRLLVEPQGDAEVYKLVGELCAGLKDDGSADGEQEKQPKGVSREIDRAVRNMAGLTVKRKKGPDGRNVRLDPAAELAQKFNSLDNFRSEVASRLKLWQRTRREISFEATSGASGLEWLKQTFTQINNGRHSDFTLPCRIDVTVPHKIVPFSECELETEIVDTKGVDQTAIRPDLQNCIDDPHTLVVFCSRFNSAPDQSIQNFLEHLKDTGFGRALKERVVLLVLPHNDEARAVKDDAGYVAETDEEAYDLKRDQVKDALQRIGVSDMPIYFFNARSDDPAPLVAELIERLNSMRSGYVDRISDVAVAIDQLIENQEMENALAAQRAVNKALKIFIGDHRELPARKRSVHDSLLKAVRSVHPRTVWATTRRNGTWGNLDVYYYLGSGAAAGANLRTRKTFEGLEELIRNKLGDPDLQPAHKFLKELMSTHVLLRENFVEAVRRAGEQTFRPTLEENYHLWSECEDIYGQGRAFRQEVAKQLEEWFEDDEQEHLHDLLETRINSAWEQDVLEPLKKLCEDTFAEAHAPTAN